jgi:AAA domain
MSTVSNDTIDRQAQTPKVLPLIPDPLAKINARFRAQRRNPFVSMSFDFDEADKPDFWDPDKTLPRTVTEESGEEFTGGCGATVLVYGEWGSHKTNVVLSMLLDVWHSFKGHPTQPQPTILYAGGEGVPGVKRLRLPAQCRAKGLDQKRVSDYLHVTDRIPMLKDDAQVDQFIEAIVDRDGTLGCDPLYPDIIVFDTLATLLAGVDESSSQAAQFLTGNGAIGRIREAQGFTVILIAHSGKDRSKGIRGNSGFYGNTDAVLRVDADEKRGLIRVTVEKMRDGETGHSIYFEIVKHEDGVPVPMRITEADYQRRGGGGSRSSNDGPADKRQTALRALEDAPASGWSDKELSDASGLSRSALRSARSRNTPWARGLWREERWFPVEQAKG